MSDRVVVGRVGRPHGLDGSFVVERPSEDPRRFAVGARLLVGDGASTVVGSKRSGGRVVIRTEPAVQRGAWLEVERSSLPATDEGEFYVFELIGLDVVEETGRSLGKVVGVIPGVANDVLELEDATLLPLIEDCVLDIDTDARRILVARGFSHAS